MIHLRLAGYPSTRSPWKRHRRRCGETSDNGSLNTTVFLCLFGKRNAHKITILRVFGFSLVLCALLKKNPFGVFLVSFSFIAIRYYYICSRLLHADLAATRVGSVHRTYLPARVRRRRYYTRLGRRTTTRCGEDLTKLGRTTAA